MLFFNQVLNFNIVKSWFRLFKKSLRAKIRVFATFALIAFIVWYQVANPSFVINSGIDVPIAVDYLIVSVNVVSAIGLALVIEFIIAEKDYKNKRWFNKISILVSALIIAATIAIGLFFNILPYLVIPVALICTIIITMNTDEDDGYCGMNSVNVSLLDIAAFVYIYFWASLITFVIFNFRFVIALTYLSVEVVVMILIAVVAIFVVKKLMNFRDFVIAKTATPSSKAYNDIRRLEKESEFAAETARINSDYRESRYNRNKSESLKKEAEFYKKSVEKETKAAARYNRRLEKKAENEQKSIEREQYRKEAGAKRSEYLKRLNHLIDRYKNNDSLYQIKTEK